MAFKKGVSGNPSGRRKGETPQARMRREIEERLPEMTALAIKKALSGDAQMFKILLDKAIPNLRPQALPVNIPIGETLSQTGNNVINTTLAGNISPDIGAQLITALSNQGKLVDLEEITDRLARIEKQFETKK